MTTMTENFKILAKYIKDMSSETPNVETFELALAVAGRHTPLPDARHSINIFHPKPAFF